MRVVIDDALYELPMVFYELSMDPGMKIGAEIQRNTYRFVLWTSPNCAKSPHKAKP